MGRGFVNSFIYAFAAWRLGAALASPLVGRAAPPVNKGLVALGIVPSDAKDSFGETLGGIGSAMTLKRGTFKKTKTGYKGTFLCQPDRGFNVLETVDYQGRHHEIQFEFVPYTSAAPLPYSTAKNTLQLDYKKTLLYTDSAGVATSGLNPQGIRASTPPLPIASSSYDHISIDPEGLVHNDDGSFWVSDEYGPYIYHFDKHGKLLSTIQPPPATLPMINGKLNFTALREPNTGRSANQGLEGLTASPNGKTLYAMMQSAIAQDGGGNKTTNRHARLLAYDVTECDHPVLKHEWVVPLPQTAKGQTCAQSEVHYLNDKQFLVLSRDGSGHGDTKSLAEYKSIDIVDVSAATDIHGTAFDTTTPVAPGGVLAAGVTAATYTPFVSILDPTQLARFGLHNGGAFDETLIDAKWESLALAPVLEESSPDDYFLFTVADNDFITEHGVSVGKPYNASDNVDTQFFVYRVTLPSVVRGSVEKAIGIDGKDYKAEEDN